MRIVIVEPDEDPRIKTIACSSEAIRHTINGVEDRFSIDTSLGKEIIGIRRRPGKRPFKLNRPLIQNGRKVCPIRGVFILTAVGKDGSLESLTKGQAEQLCFELSERQYPHYAPNGILVNFQNGKKRL